MPYDHAEIARQIQVSLAEAREAAAIRTDGTADAVGAAASSSSGDGDDPDGVLRGIVVPAGVVLLSGAGALVIRHRRRAAPSGT